MTRRCCLACSHVYRGPLACPTCGEPGEPLPHGGARDGAGRPPKGADARSVKVPVFLTPAEAARLDERRGALTRSEWLASPLRPTPAAADFRPVRK